MRPPRGVGLGRRVHPAAAASAAYAWLVARPRPAEELPVELDCTVGPVTVRLELAAAGAAQSDAEF
ncbi:hypothetical protein ACFV6F_24690 [Kitasatospora phosalacinea]|uniref:hypothetical protein n=1 Tax=Kitasatospora phosalacinea TaxID=2065 RepID=UPI00364A4B5E